MTIVELSAGNLESMISRPGVVVLECWAAWCGGCELFEPTFANVSRRHPEVTFASLDTGRHPKLAERVRVTQVPTLLVFRDGIPLLRHPGGVDEATLEDIVAQAQGLDMSIVRAEMEREAREAERTAV
jgi:thioredoxin 1